MAFKSEKQEFNEKLLRKQKLSEYEQWLVGCIPSKKSPIRAKWEAEHPYHKEVVGIGNKTLNEIRVEMIMTWITEGLPRAKRLRKCAEEFGLRQRALDNLLARANRKIQERFMVDRADFVSEKLSQLEDLYQACLKHKQYAAATGVQNTIARFTGIDGPPSTSNGNSHQHH